MSSTHSLNKLIWRDEDWDGTLERLKTDKGKEEAKNPDRRGDLPLHDACRSKAPLKVVKALLDVYSDGANIANNDGRLPIHFALMHKAAAEVVKALLEANPEGTRHMDEWGNLPFHYVKSDASPELVRVLFEAYTGKADKRGTQRLQNAIQTGSVAEVWRVLLEAYPVGAMSADNNRRWDENTRARVRGNDPTLTSLLLQGTGIDSKTATDIADSLRCNTATVWLDLKENDLGDIGVRALAGILQENCTLCSLDLSNNYICQEGLTDLSKALRQNSTLARLLLGENNIGDAGASEIALSLQDNNTLFHLDLGGINIGDAGATNIALSLQDNNTLLYLDLKKNRICDGGALSLASTLRLNNTLKTLDLQQNNISKTGVACLSDAVRENGILNLYLTHGWGYRWDKQTKKRVMNNDPTITRLDLGCRRIDDEVATDIAHTLSGNTAVASLFLKSNEIGYVGATKIACIALVQSTTLVTLDLEGNKVGDAGAEEIAKALPSSALTELNLSENSIGNAGAAKIADALHKRSTLRVLDLGANDIWDASHLAKALPSNRTLTDLNLEYNDIGDAGVASFASAIRENSTLVNLNLQGNRFGDKGWEAFAESLPHNKTLLSLQLDDCGGFYGEPVELKESRLQIRCLLETRADKRSTMKKISEDRSEIGDDGAETLASQLHKNRNVEEVRLDKSGIGDKGVASLATALCNEHSTVTKLYLRENNITDIGAAELAQAIGKNSSIEFLALEENKVGAEGVVAIAKALRTNNTLGEVHLSESVVGIDGAKGLASALRNNASLKCLELDGCDIETEGAKEIAEALRHNQTLTKLYLCENNIESNGAEAFVDVLQFNEALIRVDLSGNGIESELLERIEKLLQRNEDRVAKPWTPEERNRICFLFSDPLVWRGEDDGVLHPITEKLQLLEERSMLTRCIKESQRDIKISFDVASTDRLQTIAVARSGCLHFSGHGLDFGQLLFEDGSGGAHILAREELSKFLRHHPEPFKVVFISACYSLPIGEAFIEAGVKHVVCCEQESELNDEAAVKFTRAFYGDLFQGVSVGAAFESGRSAVSSWRKPEEAEKFMLLPEDEDHDVPVFCAHPKEYKGTESLERSPSIPAAPIDFTGREYDMYIVFNALLSGRLVTLVGERRSGLSSLSISVCHYLNERLQTIKRPQKMPTIEFIVYVNRNRAVSGFHKSLLVPLFEQLVARGNAQSTPGKDPSEDCVFDALKGTFDATKGRGCLVVFDDVRGLEDTVRGFLQRLFEKVQNVTLLLAAGQQIGYESLHAKEEVVNVGPWCTDS